MNATNTNPNQNLATKEQVLAYPDQYLLNKEQLAEHLNVNVRSVEVWSAQRKIPVIRISGKCVRFSLPRVLAALRKFELKEVG
jgi:hypothetical protein